MNGKELIVCVNIFFQHSVNEKNGGIDHPVCIRLRYLKITLLHGLNPLISNDKYDVLPNGPIGITA